jgi:ABC-type Fe3+-hydroxamate transport system, periplasmic component
MRSDYIAAKLMLLPVLLRWRVRWQHFAAGIFVAFSLLCHSAVAQVSVSDSTGTPIVLAQPAKRIITLSPHATELIAAAGALNELVAVSEYSDTPVSVRSLPIVGSATAIDYERITALKPDLIVAPAYLRLEQRALLHRYALFIADARTPEAIADEIAALGVLTGHRNEADQKAQQLRERLDRLRTKGSGKRITTFYLIWNTPIYTVGGKSLINQALQFCGADNVFAQVSTVSPVVSREAVIRAAPELMIFGATEKDFAVWRDDWQRWTQIPAVQKQNIARVDPDLMHRPGPRFIDGVEALCQAVANARARTF